MMYGALTLITNFSFISPKFRNCFLQHYYISTLYRQMPYSTVIKLNTICFGAKGYTTHNSLPFRYRGGGKGGREYAGKTGHPQRFAMQFSSLSCMSYFYSYMG